MKNSALSVGFLLFFACFSTGLFSQALLDVGIFNAPANSNKLEVRIRPTQTVTNGIYSAGIFTVRILLSSGVTLTAPAALNTPLYAYTLQGQGNDGTYAYFIFAVVNIKTVNWTAGMEYPIAILQFNASCGGLATFEIINNAWTATHNGDYYQELDGNSAQNLLYQPTATAPLSSGPPSIGCVADQTANTDPNQCTHTHPGVDWNATGSASCPGSTISYTLSGASTGSLGSLTGAVFNKGLTTVTAKITDNGGLMATCSFTVTIADGVNPTITAPAPVVVTANAPGCSATGVALGTPATADNCSVAAVTNNAPATFLPGLSSVTWKVTDGAGHTATAVQTVTVKSSLTSASMHLASPQLCAGSSTDLSFTLVGGQGPFTLVYNDGSGNTTLPNYANNQAIPVTPVATTSYSLLQATDAFGCSLSPGNLSATLVVNPLPTLGQVLPPVVSVCAGASVSFYADGLLPNVATTFSYTVNGQAFTVTATTDGIGSVTFPPAIYQAGMNTIVVTAVTVHGCTTMANQSTSFVINPPSAACNLSVGGKIATEAGIGLEEVEINIAGSGPGIPAFNLHNLTTGTYSFLNVIPPTSNLIIDPFKDNNPLNGVSTYDLVLISRHILSLDTLGSLYKKIAADANNSGSITTFDIVELRKLILGIYQKLPNNTSWRFIDASYVFPNPDNPFTINPLPTKRSITNMLIDQLQENFIAIKIGDVNGSALANSLSAAADERSSGDLAFALSDRKVKSGEIFQVQLRAVEQVPGYQFTLEFPGMELLDIHPGTGMHLDNFGVFDHALTTSFDGDQVGAFTLTFRALHSGKISDKIQLTSSITPAEAYWSAQERLGVVLRFDQNNDAPEKAFELFQNQPNPFSGHSIVRFYLPAAAHTTLTIFDALGRAIATQAADFPLGNNQFEINGAALPAAGTYYYQVKTDMDSAIRNMILIR